MEEVFATAKEAPAPNFRAMIVEDHDFQRSVGAKMLRRCGASEVLEASDGVQALRIISDSTQHIDIVLCDLDMPNMDGLAFLRHVADGGYAGSVILCSALNRSIVRATELMANTYGITIVGAIEKPLSRPKLMPLLLRHFGRQSFVPEQPAALMARDEIAAGISRNEFEPFFQPKIDVASGRLAGVEILMRWRHPERGIIAPAAFIPVMESHGLISDAMFAVFEKSVKFISRCRRLGLKVSVAVNVSPQSLCDMTLPGRLEAITSACGLSPAWVTIEITETVPMTDLGHALETLSRCRMKGFELSIDDYGTGHSSLQQLIQLPLNELKIARAFVTGASENPVLEALIQASVTMARRLNLRTVAEGVETAEDWDAVARHGCDVAQGYFIARPMTPEQLIEWYAPWLRTRGAA